MDSRPKQTTPSNSRTLLGLGKGVAARVRRALGDDFPKPVIALSGGSDSAVLAWAIGRCDRELRAVHIHHGWPGSDRMQRAAEAVADHLKLDLTVARVVADRPGSPEEVARQARYEALYERCRPGEVVATGHTLTDQAETVLGNLIWGAGLDGLRGIHRQRGDLIRPLLEVSRFETRELATLLKLPFDDDPANQDETFRRVRIRRALAEWERTLSPGIADRLADLAGLVEPELSLLDQLSQSARLEQSGTTFRIAIGELKVLPPTLAARVIRRALRSLGEGHAGTGRDVESVLTTARTGQEGRLTGDHPVVREGAYLVIGSKARAPVPSPQSLNVPGSTCWGGWRWESGEYPGRPDAFPTSRWEAVFDAGSFRGPAIVRAARKGDLIALPKGHKRVADAWPEAGIPPSERPGRPVLEVAGEVVWIPGVRRAYYGWVGPDTLGYVAVSARSKEQWKPVES
ncbi:MAG: tRNA lysidine(34) synthetase TilS [Acidimicrobiia bacterium]|nr:tRNA lysidine(34) synthetase TilS [Acidimicrobiia bacterium]